MIIQIIGQAGAGKTALASALADRINAIHINADEVREGLSKDLSFSVEDRIENARRLGELARLLKNQIVVVDFICPTNATRKAFGKPDALIWVNRIKEGRYEDSNKLWEDPDHFDIYFATGLSIDSEVEIVIERFGLYDWKAPSTLMLGRYQPWHEGHEALKERAHERTEQVVIGVRHSQGTSEKDPLSFEEVSNRIRTQTRSPFIVKMPNITNIVYGRDVGYKIEQIDLGDEIHGISATEKRKELGL